ncbi:hypothetical protein RJ639_037114 [Escallonia herrerae]|uniref:CCHC-type domain-containing protein n=1 Tax=Escallonia herrerae TaxID=1293975 RepID=A0AA88WQG9_9ASTE|nr:hypothetical protein RJ639_037114 [Escallonia herrerae]
MAEEGKGKIEKFNGMNFQWWKMQVEDYLYQKDLYLPLVGEKLEAMNASEWAILNRNALATGKKSYNRRSRSRGKSKSKGKTIVCWNCNEEGHKKNDCTEPKKKKGAGGRQSDDEGANMKNLISVSGLDREGYFVAFGEKQWKVTKGSMVVARGERVGTLYTLSGTHNHSISLAFTENQRTTLWHHRLGHLSESGMKILHSKNALPGMKNIQLDFCEGCVYGKQKRVSFPRDGKEKKIERLELVHTDVCGPTTVKSLGDDASRKNWIYAIRQKSDVYHTFKKWKVLVENETGNKFWAVAVDTAVYLINISPASALNGGIPEEEWSGKPVNYSFLRVFGCIAYAHIDKEERKKLDSKSQKCVFIGYGGDEYGYRLWDYKHNKIIRSRDVIFDESRLYKHRLQEHGIEKDNREYMELDEPEDGQVPRTENPEVLDETTDTEIGAGDQQQVPETLNLRRSSRALNGFEWTDKTSRNSNKVLKGKGGKKEARSSTRPLSLCSGRVFGRDSVRTEFCSAVVTLLGKSVQTRFCSERILLGRCHSARAECSDGILFGQNSARPLSLCSGRVFRRGSVRTEFCSATITLLWQSVREGILLGQNSARPRSLCSGRVFGRDSAGTEFCSATVTLLG